MPDIGSNEMRVILCACVLIFCCSNASGQQVQQLRMVSPVERLVSIAETSSGKIMVTTYVGRASECRIRYYYFDSKRGEYFTPESLYIRIPNCNLAK